MIVLVSNLNMYFIYTQLVEQAQFNITVEDLEHFLSSEIKPLFQLSGCQMSANADDIRVVQALEEALKWAVSQELYQVSL